MKKIEPEPTSISPEKAIIEVVVHAAMRYGISPGKAGGYLQDLADFLTTIPENERVKMLHELIGPENISSTINNRTKWSIFRNGLEPIKIVKFNIDLITVVDEIPMELQTRAINPKLLRGIAGHLKGKV